jgi:hypothetical protein
LGREQDFHDAAHQYCDGRHVEPDEQAALYCYVEVPENPVGQRLGIVSWGSMGYRLAGDQRGDRDGEDVERIASELNTMVNINASRAKDMVARSIEGWVMPARSQAEGIDRAAAFVPVSLGHIAFIGEFEYFCHEGYVWRGAWRGHVGVDRMRQGVRLVALRQDAHKWDRVEVAKAEHLRLARGGKDSKMKQTALTEGERNEA